MAYNKTIWEDLPSTNTPLSAANLNKIENELEKLDPATPYTQASGTHTTAAWGDGTSTVTWTAPRTGLYLFFSRFSIDDDSNAQIYKQFQLKGTSTRITGDVLFYQPGPLTATANALGIGIFSACSLIYAEQGQTVIPRVWTGAAGIVWNVNFTSLFLK